MFTMQNVSPCVRSHAFDVVVRRKKGGTCGGAHVVRARKGLLAEKFEKEEEKDTHVLTGKGRGDGTSKTALSPQCEWVEDPAVTDFD